MEHCDLCGAEMTECLKAYGPSWPFCVNKICPDCFNNSKEAIKQYKNRQFASLVSTLYNKID